MRLYRFDVDKWLLTCLPPALRKPVLFSLGRCCMAPIKELAADFSLYIDAMRRRLLQKPYTGSLEALLNTEMGYPQGVIYIKESDDDNQYITLNGATPEVLYLSRQPDSDTVYLTRKPDDIFRGFIVHVPGKAIQESDKNYRRIVELVENYKMSGVAYKIEMYE